LWLIAFNCFKSPLFTKIKKTGKPGAFISITEIYTDIPHCGEMLTTIFHFSGKTHFLIQRCHHIFAKIFKWNSKKNTKDFIGFYF